MSGRAKSAIKKIVKVVGGEKNLKPGVRKDVEKCLSNSRMVMRRADRGLFAGRHIQYGNNVSEDGGNKTRRNWKPNVQGKRLFSYIYDRHIHVNVTTHALRCIDKAGGFDEYLLRTPYSKMDTQFGLVWKAKIEKMYKEKGQMQVTLFAREDVANLEKQLKEVKLVQNQAAFSREGIANFKEQIKEAKIKEKATRKKLREARRKIYFWSPKPENGENEEKSTDETHEESDSHGNSHEQMIAHA